MGRHTKSLAIPVLSAAVLLFASAPALAATDQNGAIAQGYTTDSSDITTGALVSLKKGSSHTVELATTDSADRLVGIADEKPLISISNTTSKAQVVINGTALALVSDINGTVKSGDRVAPSPLAGAGMKATADGQIVGTAQSDFVVSKTTTITDKQGKQHQVRLGYVTLQVGTAYYQTASSDLLPPFVQSLANNLAGHQVSLMRILIAGLLLFIGFVSVIILVYGSVRSAMASIGRNPLAAKDIRRGLYQILLIAVVVAGGAALASYVVLRA